MRPKQRTRVAQTPPPIGATDYINAAFYWQTDLGPDLCFTDHYQTSANMHGAVILAEAKLSCIDSST